MKQERLLEQVANRIVKCVTVGSEGEIKKHIEKGR